MKKEILLKHFIIAVVILASIELLIMLSIAHSAKEDIKSKCQKAFCNADNTICYTYDINEKGTTVITWQGSCKNN